MTFEFETLGLESLFLVYRRILQKYILSSCVKVIGSINQSINLLKAKGPNGYLHHSIKYTT